MRKEYRIESNIPARVPGPLTQPLAMLRDNIVEAGAAKPYEASFLTSLLGELIRHKLMNINSGRLNPPLDSTLTFQGFRQILQVLTTPKTMRDKNINNSLKKAKVSYTNPDFGANREAGVPDEENPRMFDHYFVLDAFDVLKDFIERAVLSSPYFSKCYKFVVNNDGIAVIEKLPEYEEEEEVELQVGLTFEELNENAKAKIKILENHPKTSGLLVAYDNNWATLAFTHETRVKQKGLYSIFRDVFRDEYQAAGFDRHDLDMGWCIFSSSGSCFDNSCHLDTTIFLTISIRPLKELRKELNTGGNKRNYILAETYRYNPTINMSKIHKMDNSPHIGEHYPSTPAWVEPAKTYRYEDIQGFKQKPRKLEDIRMHGDFIMDDSNNVTDYSGNKSNITTLELPASARVLRTNAIRDFPYLHTLVLPASVTMIEAGAIRYCQRLKYIQVSDRLKIVEDNFIDNVDRVTLGVFTREDGVVKVRPPKGLVYLDKQYASKVNFTQDSNIKPIGYNGNILYQHSIEVDPNRIRIINTPELKVYKDTIKDIDIELFEKEFELPSGVTDTHIFSRKFRDLDLPEDSPAKQANAWLINKVIIDKSAYDNGQQINLDFIPTEIEVNNTTSKGPNLTISLLRPARLHRLSINANNLNYFNNLRMLRELYVYIDEESKVRTDWADKLNTSSKQIGRFNLGLGKIVTNNPIALYKILKDNEKEVNNMKIYKGTSLTDIAGEVDKKELEQGNEVLIEMRRHNNLKDIILEFSYNNSNINSYTQLIRQLKQLNILNTNELSGILDSVSFITDSKKEYKNIEFDVSYAQLPIILDSDIKVKLVKLSHEDGVILVLPNNISDSYETIKDTPEALTEVNTSLSLYAEVLGFDSNDPILQDLIKKAYLSAGNSLAAFEAPEVEVKQDEEMVDEFGGLPDIGMTPDESLADFVPMDDFAIDDLEGNFEALNKFSCKTNSLNEFINSIKKNSPSLIKENIRMARLNNILILEVNNKNIYKQLKSTPNISKTILRRFGEYLKAQENVQLIESYNANDKRYFVFAEHASNNYWYTEQDELKPVEKSLAYVVPKKDKLLVLKNSNIRLTERKAEPRLLDGRIVFIKGVK